MQRGSFRKNAFDISPKIREMALMEELGELYNVYTLPMQNTALFGIGILCIVMSCLILPFLFVAIPPPPGISITGAAFLLTGCFMVFFSRVYPCWHVFLWQYGFLSEKGRVRQVFRWDQIESLQCQTTTQHFIRCKVSRQDGTTITLTSAFPEIHVLMDNALEAFAYQCAAQELDIAPSRRVRTFTDVTLNRQGIGNVQETLSWQELQEFSTKNGIVTLRKKEDAL